MDYSKLEKEVKLLQAKKDEFDAKIQSLSEEKIKYLKEIPAFKEDAKRLEANVLNLKDQVKAVKEEINSSKDELDRINKLVQLAIEELHQASHNLVDCFKQAENAKKEVLSREDDLRKRERTLSDEFSKLNKLENEYQKNLSLLKSKENELNRIEINLVDKRKELEAMISIHQQNKANIEDKEASLKQARAFLVNDEESLKYRSQAVEKMVKENEVLRTSLLIQKDQLNEATKIAEEKQRSLDRNIADLTNKDNALKIKELKLKKMAHDQGLLKELRELEGSIK